jgi:hypothetical protein
MNPTRKIYIRTIIVIVLAIVITLAITQSLEKPALKSSSTVVQGQHEAIAQAKKVLDVFAARDYEALEKLVSPSGLSMSLTPNLDLTRTHVAENDISYIPQDTQIYFWGYTDGKGDPINLSVSEFMEKYIYTQDYRQAPSVAVNTYLGSGNSLNTLVSDVGTRTYVAFHFSQINPEYAGMDWTTLYLVFDIVDGKYLLRGIAKDNWTI